MVEGWGRKFRKPLSPVTQKMSPCKTRPAVGRWRANDLAFRPSASPLWSVISGVIAPSVSITDFSITSPTTGRHSRLPQVLLETTQSLLQPLDGPELLDRVVALRGGLEEHPHGQLGLIALPGEGRRHVKARARDMGVDQALRFHDLLIDDLILIVDAIRAMHDEPPHAARPHVHLVNRAREAVRPPPLRDVFRIRPHLEHELSRRIKDARCANFPIRRGCLVSFAHVCSPLSSFEPVATNRCPLSPVLIRQRSPAAGRNR